MSNALEWVEQFSGRVVFLAKIVFGVLYIILMFILFPWWYFCTWLILGRVPPFPKPRYLQNLIDELPAGGGMGMM